jgi:chromate transport protein ChrA
MSEAAFAEMFAISNALPGPASTQLAFTVALVRGGVAAGILAFFIWSIPGGLVMTFLGYGISVLGVSGIPNWILYIQNGLASVAVALVAAAAYKLGCKILNDNLSRTLAVLGGCLVINFEDKIWIIPTVMTFGGICTYLQAIQDKWMPKWLLDKVAPPAAPEKKKDEGKKKEEVKNNNADVEKPQQQQAVATTNGEDNNNNNDLRNRHHPTTQQGSQVPLTQISIEEINTTENQGAASSSGTSNANAATPAAAAAATESPTKPKDEIPMFFSYTVRTGFILVGITVLLLIISIILRALQDNKVADIPRPLQLLATFYFVGSIIFGGGPVVVPLLYSFVVLNDWLTPTEFVTGLAIINAMPGPNFNFACFCGALALRGNVWTSLAGGILAFIGIFLPGILLKAGVLPMWKTYRGLPTVKTIFKGLNSVAIGFVFSATYLLWEKAISVGDKGRSMSGYPFYVAIAAVGYLLVEYMKAPAPFVVLAGGVVGLFQWLALGMP